MPRYRLTFSKSGYVRFTSHLDMIRLFERAFRRAGIELEFSQGFNPHPKMVFAQPLPLGYSAEEEIVEIDTAEEYDLKDLLARTDAEMPDGIVIKTVRETEKKKKTVAADCFAADYRIEIESSSPDKLADAASELIAADHFVVTKKTKRGERDMDIRPMIRSLDYSIQDNKIILSTKLDTGSRSNLSPQQVTEAISRLSKSEIPPENIEISRLKLYV
ncbi:MAG: TIGR03936 family radical SAM-associated protein [Anaerovoracaceae bacterium]|nr:TIGR03936 family radical SAM-associated protein [Anaerovoracaceae bacterium]